MPTASASTRRDFLRWTASLSANAMLLPFWTGTDSAGTPGGLGLGRQVAWPQAEPWGTLQPVGDGIWAMLSTPLVDRKTLCNGGIIAGRDGVLMVEAFGSDDGARWMRERARELTRREPTQVLLTHYHADHAGGLRAAREADAELWCTARTRDDVATRNQGAPAELLPDATVLPQEGERVLDLGGRRVRLLSLDGHTASDVVAVVEDAGVVFAGDLVWYGMFPNFVDAQPSRLTRAVRALRALDARVYVSGHGQTTDTRGVDAYIGLLDLVERAARDAQAAGRSAAEAAADFRMPPQMADWTLFNPRYFERAIGAWLTELSPS